VDVGTLLAAGWARALVLGAIAFLAIALVGQILAMIAFAADHAMDQPTLGFVNALRIGGFYFFGFHHVTISVSGAIPGGTGFGGDFAVGFSIAILLVTGFAAFLLYGFGRRVANELEGSPWVRALHGAKVGVPYALASLILSFVLSVDFPAGPGSTAATVSVAHISAFLFPLILGLVAGGLGGLLSARAGFETERWGRRTVVALVSGWRMFVAGLMFAFVSLLIMGGLHPNLTADVVRAELNRNGGYGTAFVNHLLLTPNQSILVLVPAMGGCDGVYGGGGGASVSFNLLCYGHFPSSQGATPLAPGGGSLFPGGGPLPQLPFGFGTAPAIYFLFLLLPLATVLYGGADAARRGRPETQGEAMGLGALAGVVFAVLLTAGTWLGGIGLSAGGGVLGLNLKVSGMLGARVTSALLFGLLWGVVGGALGAAARHARTEQGPRVERGPCSASDV
jgi:hypothetical protein